MAGTLKEMAAVPKNYSKTNQLTLSDLRTLASLASKGLRTPDAVSLIARYRQNATLHLPNGKFVELINKSLHKK